MGYSKIYVIKANVKKYSSLIYTGRLWDEEIKGYVYNGKEVGYVLKAELHYESFTNINPVSSTIEIRIRVDLNKAELREEEVKQKIREFVKKVIEDYKEYEIVDENEIYRKLVELATEICAPYTTTGQKVEIYDSGGDYPEISLKFIYYA